MKNELDALLQKEMDRKSFLKHVAIGFAAITGIAAAIKTLNSVGNPRSQSAGYGSAAYGGNKTQSTPSSTTKS